MSKEPKMDPLKPREVDIAKRMIDRNHPLHHISIFKALPFLEVITCRRCWRKEDENAYVNMDEHKLLRFQQLKQSETMKHKQKNDNAAHLKEKLVRLTVPMVDQIIKEDPDTAKEVMEEHNKIEEEEKEHEIGTFMRRNTTNRDLEDDDN